MAWFCFPGNVSFLKTEMWLVKGPFHGSCGQTSQWVGVGKAKTGVDLSASPEMIDSPGSQIQWICTKENHIAKLSIRLLPVETDAFIANFLAELPGHGPGSM